MEKMGFALLVCYDSRKKKKKCSIVKKKKKKKKSAPVLWALQESMCSSESTREHKVTNLSSAQAAVYLSYMKS